MRRSRIGDAYGLDQPKTNQDGGGLPGETRPGDLGLSKRGNEVEGKSGCGRSMAGGVCGVSMAGGVCGLSMAGGVCGFSMAGEGERRVSDERNKPGRSSFSSQSLTGGSPRLSSLPPLQAPATKGHFDSPVAAGGAEAVCYVWKHGVCAARACRWPDLSDPGRLIR